VSNYIFDMPHGSELAGIAFSRREACRSTLSGCVSPRFRAPRRIDRHMARRLKSKTKSREARGYGPSHRMRRRMLSPRVEAGLEYCARCGERILQGEPWDIGHDDYDRRLYLGP